MNERELWAESLRLAGEFVSGKIEEPKERFDLIALKLGNCINDVKDLHSLLRIARKSKDEN